MSKITLLFLLLCGIGYSQTWSDDVAAIVYDKCSKCHHSGGIAPFELMSYSDVSGMSSSISAAISSDEMPPWPPDEMYQQYSHSRALTPTQKTTFLNWISNGMPTGTMTNAPAPPVFNSGSILGNGDLTVQIPSYASKAMGGHDDYVCFSIPSGLLQNRTIKAMEVVPGNRQIVHHALIYIDPSASYVTDTVGGDCGGPSGNVTLVGGYTPGSMPMILPSSTSGGLKLGIDIPANSNIVFAMHYPDGSFGMVDSTKVIFHFYPIGETGIRTVSAAPVIQNWTMAIPPEQVVNYTAQYPSTGGIPIDMSILSVFPHMHLLGETIKAYAVNATNDTTKFINIHHWDFHWQDFYYFKHMQKAEAGSVIKGEASFDNTSSNPHNPHSPPQTVYAGFNTTDEMFIVYFHYLPYLPGDELYDIESLTNLSVAEITADQNWQIYPVPFSENITFKPTSLKAGDIVSISIYDTQGRLIKKICERQVITSNSSSFIWNGKSEDGYEVKSGTYFISMNCNGEFSSQTIMKR